ncbi:hypothetical protein L195_g015973 [Trifolium pratense]|uniref:Myb/SANT-like domain-containing protein n=1 Tax=Trifolium pratense TaxID=57577 RepID=A0A2K3MPT8_TRIPR|nr:hypothetical protein L195_g015973 [Trifolium pratense]
MEAEACFDILIEAVNKGQRCENGQFKAHTLRTAETKLEEKIPGCGIKSHPNAKDYWYALIALFDKLALAFGKDCAKSVVPPADNVKEIDKEDEEQCNDEENEIGMTQSPSINQSKRKLDHMEIQFRKRNKGASIIAQSIFELGKSFGTIIDKSSERLCEAANCLGFG